MYQINYADRAIFRDINGLIHQVVIDYETKEPISFRYQKTDNNYKILSDDLVEEESLDKIIDILEDDLANAKSIAKEWFDGITDKAGKNYFEGHLTSVSNCAFTYQGKIVAYLHDLIEDTDYNFYELNFKFGQITARSVLTLTRPPEASYKEYIGLISNPIAIEVKICDLKNNMDMTRLNEVTDKDLKRLEKYKKALAKFGEDHRSVYKNEE